MGEMGQLLASESFMAALPQPLPQTWIYAGTKGPRGRFSPFGEEPNDGILLVAETQVAGGIPVVEIPASHTFIMNSRLVAEGIADTVAALQKSA